MEFPPKTADLGALAFMVALCIFVDVILPILPTPWASAQEPNPKPEFALRDRVLQYMEVHPEEFIRILEASMTQVRLNQIQSIIVTPSREEVILKVETAREVMLELGFPDNDPLISTILLRLEALKNTGQVPTAFRRPGGNR